MGILRTIFAISVVIVHSYGKTLFVGGENAVQLFYITSGFLISFVLVEAKSYPSIKHFYINRYLRLYPVYFVVAAMTFASYWMLDYRKFFDVYELSSLGGKLLLVFSNMFLFLQDWVMFAGIENNSLVFTENFQSTSVILYPGLLIPQAWTLGVELSFYLIAPFVLRSRKWLFFALACSLAVRMYLIKVGLALNDPWTYRFFPAELALFLFGALAHQFLLPWYRKNLNNRGLEMGSKCATLILVVFTLTYFLIPGDEVAKKLCLIATFVFLMPFAFLFQNSHRFDRKIGDLSYPIYIGHMFVVGGLVFVFKKLGLESKPLLGVFSVLLSVLFAVLLNKWVADPFEKLRAKIRKASLRNNTMPH